MWTSALRGLLSDREDHAIAEAKLAVRLAAVRTTDPLILVLYDSLPGLRWPVSTSMRS